MTETLTIDEVRDLMIRFFLHERAKARRRGKTEKTFRTNHCEQAIRYRPFILNNIYCLCPLVHSKDLREQVLSILREQYHIDFEITEEPNPHFHHRKKKKDEEEYWSFLTMRWINSQSVKPFYEPLHIDEE
jgi:hypothetical protein